MADNSTALFWSLLRVALPLAFVGRPELVRWLAIAGWQRSGCC